ncbi:MAG: DUF5808 domain-containing protein [Vagococcus sp.]|uniref:DUF1648 domain-containing protein n=1 Tax=Vagococcus sp. TaxID=1933889 RepID=UPI002FC5F367
MINVVVMLFFNIMIGLILGLTPFYSKLDMPFGVTLPKDEATKKIINHQKKSYLFLNVGMSVLLSVGILTFALFQKEVELNQLIYFSTSALFIQLILSLGVYITKYKQLRQYKSNLDIKTTSNKKIVVDLSFRDQKLIFPTSYLVGLNMVFVLLTLIITITYYNQIPDNFVTKWDMNMNPVIVTDKSWANVLAIPAIQLFMTVVMGIGNQAYLKGKQQIDTENPEESIARNRKFRKQSSLLNLVISILTQILFVFIQFSIVFQQITPQMMMILTLIFTVTILVIVLWFSLRYGQGGDRLKQVNVKESEDIKHLETGIFDDDANWKLGMFYFNKKDPSFWIEKRMGLGMTFNFAKWQSWAFMVGVILVPLLIGFLMS